MKKILACVLMLMCLSSCQKKSIRVAILDSGISNVDGNIVSGYNYIEGNDDTADDRGHGSMLAEIILSYAPDCTLIPLKVSCSDPKVTDLVISALQDCIDVYDADLICMAFSIPESEELHEVIQRADRNGITMISAAGNIGDGMGILYPAGYQEVVSAGALNDDGEPASYSMIKGVDVFVDGTWKQALGTSVACARVTGMFAQGKWHNRYDVQK